MHTPGPWKAEYFPKTTFSDWNGWYIQRAEGIGLAKIATIDAIDYMTGTECGDNARLIAAAPELLQACLALMKAEPMQQGERNGAIMGMISSAIDAARAAISKATGA